MEDEAAAREHAERMAVIEARLEEKRLLKEREERHRALGKSEKTKVTKVKQVLLDEVSGGYNDNYNNAGGGATATATARATATATATATAKEGPKIIKFISKKKREEMRREAEAKKKEEEESAKSRNNNKMKNNNSNKRTTTHTTTATNKNNSKKTPHTQLNDASILNQAQISEIRRAYVGRTSQEIAMDDNKRKEKEKQKKRTQFKFEWTADEDTSRDSNPIYDYTARKVGKKREVDPLERMSIKRSNTTENNNVYSKPIENMNVRDWRILRKNHDIRVRGGKAPNPLRHFNEGNPVAIHPRVLRAIKETLRYQDPSPIQRQAIPIGLQRRDLIGIAETGSGKTCAFGIPMCHHVLSMPQSVQDTVSDNGPLALVMAPTRELAIQIDEELGKLLSFSGGLKTLPVVGGQDIETQAFKLRKGVHIVVGTPGRMVDCLESSYMVLNQCNYVVLDEADRMLDLGFGPEMKIILDSMMELKSENEMEAYEQEQKDLMAVAAAEGTGQNTSIDPTSLRRLTAMFSATMPAEVERLAKEYLRHPAIIQIGDQDSGKNKRIEQRILYLASERMKDSNLQNILSNSGRDEKIIVFVNEKRTANQVGTLLDRKNFGKPVVVLHGGKQQEEREANLALFKSGGAILVATDVAGRGLDIPNVSHVINYDLPGRSIDNYCHRIGRTGRAGKSGIATSFMTDKDEQIMRPLQQYLESTKAAIPPQMVEKLRKGDHDNRL